jgi:hypothetical protein
MAIIEIESNHFPVGTYGNITIYYLNGQLIARTVCRRYKKRKK